MDENMNNTNGEFNQNSSGTTQQSTGNGSYEYGQSNGGDTRYHSAYSNSYGSNQPGSGSNHDHHNKKHGKGGKVAFAVILAAVFGVCAGAGAYGISRAAGSGSLSSMNSSDEEIAGSATTGEEEAKADTEDTESSEDASTEASTEAAKSEDSSGSGTLKLMTGEEVDTQVTKVAEDVMPSIVSVYNNFTQTTQNLFGQTYEQEGQSTGSGIIIGKTDDELLIATNNHVVADEDSLEVQFIDETTADANVKGTDSSNDLAVIAVKLDDIDSDTMDKIKVATLGDSDSLKVGEPVVAIGNALGYGQSVTTGVVSALNREIDSQDSETGQQISGTFIQTDAAINPGNSGGALVDLNGNVIGINSSKIGGETVEGMGYAIPMSKAAPIIEDLMNQSTKEKVASDKKGYLGISGVSVTSQVSAAYNMPEGVYVAQIIDGGGAADSDLQKGDIITGIEGSTVSTMEELQKQLEYYEAGQEVTLTVERAASGGEYKEVEVKVTLGDASTIQNDENSRSQNGQSNGNARRSQRNDSSSSDKSDDSSSESSTEDSSSADTEDQQNGNGNEEGSDPFGFYTFPWNQW